MSKVLLVNDCRFESLIMKDMLDNLGYEVETSDEFEALEKIKFSYPDTVIVNLIMKNIQGDELITRIKGKYEDIRCILSSSNPIKLEEFKSRKVDAVIHTPIKKEELMAALKQKPQSSYKFCPYCGEKLNNSFSFCPSCGKKI